MHDRPNRKFFLFNNAKNCSLLYFKLQYEYFLWIFKTFHRWKITISSNKSCQIYWNILILMNVQNMKIPQTGFSEIVVPRNSLLNNIICFKIYFEKSSKKHPNLFTTQLIIDLSLKAEFESIKLILKIPIKGPPPWTQLPPFSISPTQPLKASHLYTSPQLPNNNTSSTVEARTSYLFIIPHIEGNGLENFSSAADND